MSKERKRVDSLEKEVSGMRSEMEERMAVQAELIAMQAKQMQVPPPTPLTIPARLYTNLHQIPIKVTDNTRSPPHRR